MNCQEILIKMINYVCDKEKEYFNIKATSKNNDDIEDIKSSLKFLIVIQDIKQYILS